MTESATVGTATDAINRLPIDATAKEQLISSAAVAFAVTYFLGVLTVIAVLSRLGPRLLGVDLEASCKTLEKEMGVLPEGQDAATGYQPLSARTFRVDRDTYVGRIVGEIERTLLGQQRRVFIPRVRHGGAVVETEVSTRIQKGATIALGGRRAYLMPAETEFGPGVDYPELLDFPVESLDVVVTSRTLVGKTIGELAARSRSPA